MNKRRIKKISNNRCYQLMNSDYQTHAYSRMWMCYLCKNVWAPIQAKRCENEIVKKKKKNKLLRANAKFIFLLFFGTDVTSWVCFSSSYAYAYTYWKKYAYAFTIINILIWQFLSEPIDLPWKSIRKLPTRNSQSEDRRQPDM